MKLRHHDGIGADDAIDVAIEAIFQAADEDIATGGPDTVRGIYPVVALITVDGFEQLADDDVAVRTGTLLDRLRGAS